MTEHRHRWFAVWNDPVKGIAKRCKCGALRIDIFDTREGTL